MILRGFDISSWQRLPPVDWFRAMREMGFEACVVQLWGSNPFGRMMRSQYAFEQLRRAEEAGVRLLGGYFVVPPDTTTQTRFLVQEARNAAGPFAAKLRLIALDLEIPKPLHPSCPIERLLDAATWCAHFFPIASVCVYTRQTVWRSIMQEDNPWPGEVPTLPLWEARWVVPSGNIPEQTPPLDHGWLAFGGWERRAALQYAGDVVIKGTRCDLNLFDLERLRIEL